MFAARDCKRIKKCMKLILFLEEKNIRELSFMKIYSRSYFISIFGNGLKMNTTGIIILSAKKNVLQRNMKDHNDSAVFKFFN